MNLAYADQEKNLNVVVEHYKKKIADENTIIPKIVIEIKIFFELKSF